MYMYLKYMSFLLTNRRRIISRVFLFYLWPGGCWVEGRVKFELFSRLLVYSFAA